MPQSVTFAASGRLASMKSTRAASSRRARLLNQVPRIAIERGVARIAGQGGVHARDELGVLRADAHFLQAQHVGHAELRQALAQLWSVVAEPADEVLDVPGHDAQVHVATVTSHVRRAHQGRARRA